MADYYPLIARAVDGIAEGTPEARGAVYQRARSALMLQLRSLEPPLSEDDIERERLKPNRNWILLRLVAELGDTPDVQRSCDCTCR